MDRIVRPADFERVLGTPACSRTAHFALHHVLDAPQGKLSTSVSDMIDAPVDESLRQRRRLGLVVPKRHAKRSVMRTLLKRQIRAAALRHEAALAAGWWVVRVKSAFDRKQWPSAASEPLKALAATELDALLLRGAQSRPSAP